MSEQIFIGALNAPAIGGADAGRKSDAEILDAVPEAVRPVLRAYLRGQPVANDELYEGLKSEMEAHPEQWQPRSAPPASCKDRNLAHRRARWAQQTLRQLGLLQRVGGRRGVWQLTPQKALTPAAPGRVLLAFSTKLGLCLWADCGNVFTSIDEPISLVLTSPPYPIRKPRAYGGITADAFSDFICRALEPLVRNLQRGGTLALNLSPDTFESGLPSRSTFIEEATLDLKRKLSLHLIDRVVWVNPARPPGPVRWSSMTRQLLTATYEVVLLFTNDPLAFRGDNRRVLQPHTDRHRALMARGGEPRSSYYADGAHRLRPGSFGAETTGSIPRNVLQFVHNSGPHAATRQAAIGAGLPPHGACMPLGLAKFLVQYLTRDHDLVVDPYGGWSRTGLAAEQLGRRWICTELHAEYAAGGAHPFKTCPGYRSNFELRT